jgi:hypothetical protein
MSSPRFARPDLCSIHAATEQEEPAEAVRGGFSADGSPLGDDDPPAPPASGIDRAIRLSTAVAVLTLAGIAAYVSYWHAYAVVRADGETGITARLEPATIDGLVYASSMVVLYAARHKVPVPSLARWLLGLGIAATLTANMAQGWSHGLVGADEVLEASAVNDAAVAAYRLSVQAGNPLSERRLAQMFGRTSRRWARARITDARQTSPLPDSPSTLVPASIGGLGRSAGQALPGCLPGSSDDHMAQQELVGQIECCLVVKGRG